MAKKPKTVAEKDRCSLAGDGHRFSWDRPHERSHPSRCRESRRRPRQAGRNDHASARTRQRLSKRSERLARRRASPRHVRRSSPSPAVLRVEARPGSGQELRPIMFAQYPGCGAEPRFLMQLMRALCRLCVDQVGRWFSVVAGVKAAAASTGDVGGAGGVGGGHSDLHGCRCQQVGDHLLILRSCVRVTAFSSYDRNWVTAAIRRRGLQGCRRLRSRP